MFNFKKLTDEQLEFLVESVVCPFDEDEEIDCDNCIWVSNHSCIPYEFSKDAKRELLNRKKFK